MQCKGIQVSGSLCILNVIDFINIRKFAYLKENLFVKLYNKIEMKYRLHILTFAFLFLCLNSFAGGGKKVKKLTEEEKIKLDFTYVDAARAKITGNLEEAISKYLECLKIDPKNDAAMFEIAQIYLNQKKMEESLSFAKQAADLNPANEWYLQLLADIYERNNQHKEVIRIYQQLIKNQPLKIEYYFQLASAYALAQKPDDAIKTFNRIEELNGINPDVSMEKEHIYLKQNKLDKAIEEIQKLVAAFPKETKYYGILAELYQNNKMEDKAQELYKKILVMDPNNSFVHLSLADFYRSKGEKEKSYNELKLAFENKDLDIETKLRILSSYYPLVFNSKEMMQQALKLGKILVTVHYNDTRSFAIYGDFLIQNKNTKEARDNYREAIKLDKKTFAVWQQLFAAESELRDFESMLKESDEALSLFPTQPIVYFFNGLAKAQSNKNSEAVEQYKAGLNLVIDNKDLEEQLYASLGDSYDKLKDFKKSDEAFDKALNIKPKDTYVLNNYAYYLSLRVEKLEKAEAMSKLSNELEPNSHSYEDTYGWILYKLNKYSDAKIWIQKALEHGGNKTAVILEHLGDTLYKLGDVQNAVQNWEEAKKNGKGSELLDRKLADKKLYE